MGFRSPLLAALLVASALHIATARADGLTASDRETARGLMDDGDRKVAAKDYAGALRAYEGADALMHVPTTGIEVARTRASLGLLLESREAALAVLRIPRSKTEPAPFVAARAAADALAADVGARIPSVELTILGPPPGASSIVLDGEPVPPQAATLPRRVNPGKHVVVVNAPGWKSVTREVTIAERDRATLQLQLEAEATAPRTPAGEASGAPASSGAGASPPTSHTLAYAMFGVGAAGLVTGAITGALSLKNTSDAKAQYCHGSQCDPRGQSEISSAKVLAWTSDVALGVGIAAVVAGGISFFMSGSHARGSSATALQLTPAPMPSGGSVVLRGAF